MASTAKLNETIEHILHRSPNPYFTTGEKFIEHESTTLMSIISMEKILFEIHLQPFRKLINTYTKLSIGNYFAHGVTFLTGFWWGYETAGKHTDSEAKKMIYGIGGGALLDVVVESIEYAPWLLSNLETVKASVSNFITHPNIQQLGYAFDHFNKQVDFAADFGRGALLAAFMIPVSYGIAKAINYYKNRDSASNSAKQISANL